jgi:hypothetical protein
METRAIKLEAGIQAGLGESVASMFMDYDNGPEDGTVLFSVSGLQTRTVPSTKGRPLFKLAANFDPAYWLILDETGAAFAADALEALESDIEDGDHRRARQALLVAIWSAFPAIQAEQQPAAPAPVQP